VRLIFLATPCCATVTDDFCDRGSGITSVEWIRKTAGPEKCHLPGLFLPFELYCLYCFDRLGLRSSHVCISPLYQTLEVGSLGEYSVLYACIPFIIYLCTVLVLVQYIVRTQTDRHIRDIREIYIIYRSMKYEGCYSALFCSFCFLISRAICITASCNLFRPDELYLYCSSAFAADLCFVCEHCKMSA